MVISPSIALPRAGIARKKTTNAARILLFTLASRTFDLNKTMDID
jgi:hypothetical protein